MLETLCSTLNNQPLDPDYSNTCPGDFLSGYRQIPLDFDYHDTRTTRRNFERIREGYEELRKVQKGARLLSPYVWKTKGLGRVKRDVRENDVLFIRSIKKLGLVKEVSTTQVRVKFINTGGLAQEGWYPKNDVIYLLAGSIFDNKQPPTCSPTTRVSPEKGKPE